MGKGQHVLLTGPPGIGKTTVVKNVVQELAKRNVARLVTGFYTEEIRDHDRMGKRVGFQVVTLEGKTGTFASTESQSPLKVGNYGVDIKEFENIAIPTLAISGQVGDEVNILVIDEIGKMELFSSRFKSTVKTAFRQPNTIILATIPIRKEKPIEFVEEIRNHPSAKLLTVTRDNRENLGSYVADVLLS